MNVGRHATLAVWIAVALGGLTVVDEVDPTALTLDHDAVANAAYDVDRAVYWGIRWSYFTKKLPDPAADQLRAAAPTLMAMQEMRMLLDNGP